MLAGAGTEWGLLGPREVPRLWERHLLNSAVVAPLLPADASVYDVGSGAGLPGIVLAIRRPDLSLTLVEPLLRRATFLSEVVADLGLDNVDVRRARAEALPAATADAVTARAVAPLDRLLRWCVPLLRPGGSLLALKGQSAEDELAGVRDSLPTHGVVEATVVPLETAGVDEPTWVIRAVVGASPPAQASSTAVGAARSRGRGPARRGRPRRAR